jgi:hypothetical protein
MAVVTRLERKSRRWDAVWQADSEAVASIVAGRLEADGIRTRVQGHGAPYRVSTGTLGGTWAILVPAGRAERARELLRDNEEGHNVIEAEGDEGLTDAQRSTLRFVIVGVALIAVLGVLLTFLGGR